MENSYERNRLLKRYGARERNRVEDRAKNVTTALAEIARACCADLVKENLKNIVMNGRKGSRKLSHRLQTLPYRKTIFNLDYKAYERI